MHLCIIGASGSLTAHIWREIVAENSVNEVFAIDREPLPDFERTFGSEQRTKVLFLPFTSFSDLKTCQSIEAFMRQKVHFFQFDICDSKRDALHPPNVMQLFFR